MQAENFLKLLDENGLLPKSTLEALYAQIESKKSRGKSVAADALADLLVDKGMLTRHQAKNALAECERLPPPEPDYEDLGLAPDGDTDRANQSTTVEEDLSSLLVPLDEPSSPPATSSAVASPPEQEEPVADLEELGSPRTLEAKPSVVRPKSIAEKEWESPLFLIGSGVLVLLILAAGLFFFLVRSGSGKAQLQAAHEAYDDGSFVKAIELYESFLEDHSGHEDTSLAKVKLNVARVRRDTSQGADFQQSLQTAQTAVNELANEPALHEATGEFAALFPKIAEGLADAAVEADDDKAAAALMDDAEEALALLTNTKYVPKSFRPEDTIADVRRKLELVQARSQRAEQLAASIDAINEAIAQEQPRDAYASHAKLLDEYPELAANDKLNKAVAAIAQAEKDAIRFEAQSRPAETTEAESEIIQAEMLVSAVSEVAADASGEVAPLLVNGVLYGIDLASGTPIWRRPVGGQWSNGSHSVIAYQDALFAIDHNQGFVMRLHAASGALEWRQSVNDPRSFLQHQDKLLVWGNSEHVAVLDAASGEMQGSIRFSQQPQQIVADPASDSIIAIGAHSSIYLLDNQEWKCRAVHYVGHRAGSLQAGPALIGNKLFLAENEGTSSCHLRAVAINEQEFLPIDETVVLEGHVSTPLLSQGRRLAAVTDIGEIRVWEVNPTNDGGVLSQIAQRGPIARGGAQNSEAPHVAIYSLLDGNTLWLADQRLIRYTILPTGNRLQSRDLSETFAGDTFVGPLRKTDRGIIHVRRQASNSEFAVALTDMEGGQTIWESAIPQLPVDATSIRATGNEHPHVAILTSRGTLYVINSDGTQHSIPLDSEGPGEPEETNPKQSTDQQLAFSLGDQFRDSRDRLHAIPGGTMVRTRRQGKETRVDAFAFGAERVSAQRYSTPFAVTGGLALLQGQLLAPTEEGTVYLINAANGDLAAAPFQPLLDPQEGVEWLAPVADPEGNAVFIADSRGRVYRLELLRDPMRVAAVAESEAIEEGRITSLVPWKDAVWAGTSTGELIQYAATDLRVMGSLNLQQTGACLLYPEKEQLLVYINGESFSGIESPDGNLAGNATASDKESSFGVLASLTQDQEEGWQYELRDRLCGPPVLKDGRIVGVYESGVLFIIDDKTGQPIAERPLGQAIEFGPFDWAERLLCVTRDGTCLVVNAL